MKNLRILVDLDDTMEEFIPRWIQAINYLHGKNASVDDVDTWFFGDIYPDIEPDELFEPLTDYEFWSGVQEKEGAAKYIKKLIDDGHTVRVVTSSDYRTLCAKMDCMFFRLFPFLTWDDVIVTTEKGCVKGDVIIDDNPKYMRGFDGLKLLMDAPHNKDKTEITRVYNWREIYDIVTSYAESIGLE